MSRIDVRKRSSVLALSLERSRIRVGSDINCDRSFTMAKALCITTSRTSDMWRVGGDFRAWRLKSIVNCLKEMVK